MEMNENPYQGISGLPNPSTKNHLPYIEAISTASKWINEHKGAPLKITDPIADFIIYLSFLTQDSENWKSRFIHSQNTAGFFYTTPDRYWRTIALSLTTPSLKNLCLQILPNVDQESYFPTHYPKPIPLSIIPKLIQTTKKNQSNKKGKPWKLDDRWDHLWPSSRKVFQEIRRRTQYPKKRDDFPWTQAGIKSLSKYSRISKRQTIRALHQLQQFGLIKRMFKGNTFIGASKYYVFIDPSVSGAFKIKSLSRSKH